MDDDTARVPFGDFIQTFQIEGLGIRGRFVRLEPTLQAMVGARGYPPVVAELLAEAAVLTAVLAGGLKFDGVFSLQVRGDGPVGLLFVDITNAGALRGYARFDAERLAQVVAAGVPATATVPLLLGRGHLAFTVDQGPDTERYQGLTTIEGGTLRACAEAYFRDSEQIATALQLVAGESLAGTGARRAAALVIQQMPAAGGTPPKSGDTDGVDRADSWRSAVLRLATVRQDELLDPLLSSVELLYRLFHEDGVRLYRQKPLRFGCRCSREKVERTLRAFPADDLGDLAIGGNLEVTCEFCGALYGVPLEAVSKGSGNGGPSPS